MRPNLWVIERFTGRIPICRTTSVSAVEAVERPAATLRSGRGDNLESIVGYSNGMAESATNKLEGCNSTSLHHPPPLVEAEPWSVALVYGPGWSSTSTQS